MKKSDFISVFKKNEKVNFVICTNIAKGRGINGVSFNEYVGAWEKPYERSFGKYYEYNHIAGFVGDCVVIEHERSGEEDHYLDGKRTFYIPLENIVSVVFLKDGTRPWRGIYPASVRKCELCDL